MVGYTAVRVDDEYAADEWWTAVRESYPSFAAAISRDNAAVIAESLWHTLAALPGFAGGPDYAPAALIDCGSTGDQWADVVGGRHRVFDALS